MKKKIPEFKSAKEEADFWDTHNIADYANALNSADDVYIMSPALAHKVRERAKKRLISIRLAEWEIEKSKEIAKKKKIPYQALMRQWIDEGLRAEFGGPAAR